MVIYVPAQSVNDYNVTSPWKNYTIISLSCVVTASANPEDAGIITGAGEYTLNDTVTLTAIPNEGYKFISWTENGEVVSTDLEFTFVVTSNRNLAANFELLTYEVAVTANIENAGSVSGDGTYSHGEEVTLTATPNEGYKFISWTENNNLVSIDKEYSFVVANHRNLVANFEKTYEITATVNPEKVGVVMGKGAYSHGDNVTLVAIPVKTGYEFVNWTEDGEVVSEDVEYSFVATSDRELVANFVLLNYYVSAVANAAEAGEILGSGNYNHGEDVTLTAVANEGYKFVNWTEDGEVISSVEEYSFVIIKDRNLVANFEKLEDPEEPGEGVAELTSSFRIYPNPANDKLYIEVKTEIKEIVVYDIYGKTQKLKNSESQNLRISVDLSNLNAGIYFIRLVTNDGVITKQFVKN